ncbi:MAG: hypothetical protein ACO1QR_09570 [Chthoniobacteraceae bacterium]
MISNERPRPYPGLGWKQALGHTFLGIFFAAWGLEGIRLAVLAARALPVPTTATAFFGAVGVLVIGLGLFRLREKQRAIYGSAELGFAWGASYQALEAVLQAGEVTLPTTLAIAACVYVAVRGFDNLSQGLRAEHDRWAQISANFGTAAKLAQSRSGDGV